MIKPTHVLTQMTSHFIFINSGRPHSHGAAVGAVVEERLDEVMDAGALVLGPAAVAASALADSFAVALCQGHQALGSASSQRLGCTCKITNVSWG